MKVILILIAIFAIVFILVGLDMRLKVVRYQLSGKTELKIIQISDLHGCYYGRNMSTLTSIIDSENPDIIVYTGDIFDDDVPYKHSIIFLENIGDYPSYYVNGNHEHWSNDLENIRNILTKNSVEILDDRSSIFEKNNKKVVISGIEDPASKKDIKKQLSSLQTPNDSYNILLAHRPELVEEYVKYDFDLILSGHAHGGQWRLPYLLNGLFVPNQGIFPKYAGGYYSVKGKDFIISRGLARESTPFVPRFYNRPELVVIEISSRS